MDTITAEQALINIAMSPVGGIFLMCVALMAADIYVKTRKNRKEEKV